MIQRLHILKVISLYSWSYVKHKVTVFALSLTLFLCSAHLCAFPDCGVGLRGVRLARLGGCCVLLSLPPTQTRTYLRGWASPGVHPHDDLKGILLPSVEHSHLVQLFSPAQRHSSYPWSCSRPHFARPGIVLPAARCQCLRQHAHQLLCVKLPAGNADHASPGSVPASSVHRLRPPSLTHPGLPGPYAGCLQGPAVSISSTYECDEHDKCEWRAEAAVCDYMRGSLYVCVTQRSKSHEDPESRVSSGPGAVLCVCHVHCRQ